MLQPGIAKKVTIHLNEDTSSSNDFLYKEIFAFLLAQGVSGASIVKPSAGFGAHHRIHQLEMGPLSSEHLPIRIEFIDNPEMVAAIMPELCAILTDGLIEVQDTTVYKIANNREPAT